MSTTVPRPYRNVRRVTLATTAWVEIITVDDKCKVSFWPETNEVYLGYETVAGAELVDNQAFAATDQYTHLPADQYTAGDVGAPGRRNRTSHFVSAPTAPTTICIVVENS